MPVTTLNNIWSKPDVLPRLDTLENIAKALDMSLDIFIEKAGFKLSLHGNSDLRFLADQQNKNPRLRSMIEKMAHLSREQQDVVEAMVTTLLNQRL